MQSLQASFVIAMLVIHALLAVTFGSYLQPLIVMVSIPLGIVGATLITLILVPCLYLVAEGLQRDGRLGCDWSQLGWGRRYRADSSHAIGYRPAGTACPVAVYPPSRRAPISFTNFAATVAVIP